MAWLMFSSGARPEYLQNVSTFIAVPAEGELQVRYRRKHVSAEFNAAHDAGELVGAAAYLCYLDNRDPNSASRFVPLREAWITAVQRLGEIYVVRLSAKRYFRHDFGAAPEAALRGLAKSSDIPTWVKKRGGDPALQGYWSAKLSAPAKASLLIDHDAGSGAHLEAFQNTVTALSEHSDFEAETRRMFFNVVDVREEKSGASMLGDPPLKMKTGQPYRLTLFHFFKEVGAHADWKPFWMTVASEVGDLQFSTPSTIEIASAYDIKEVHFSLPRFSEVTNIGMSIFLSNDAKAEFVVSKARINVPVQSPALAARVFIIAAALTGTQCVLMLRSGWDTTLFVVTAFASIIVGLASVYKLPAKP